MSFSHQIVQDRDHGREVFHIDKYYLYYFNMKQSDVTRISILYASIYNLIASSHKKPCRQFNKSPSPLIIN